MGCTVGVRIAVKNTNGNGVPKIQGKIGNTKSNGDALSENVILSKRGQRVAAGKRRQLTLHAIAQRASREHLNGQSWIGLQSSTTIDLKDIT
jgi:hypothetical protein